MDDDARPFEILEDDLLPNPIIQKMIRDGKFPDHYDLSKPQGKVWLGHAYRVARELSYERDAGLRLTEIAQALLAASFMLPRALIEECILLSIEEVKNGRSGIPTVPVDDPEKLAEWREKILTPKEEEKETLKH